MTHNGPFHDPRSNLLTRLRQLPRELPPSGDHWPQVALRAGITSVSGSPEPRPVSRLWRRGLLALAASALLASVMIGTLVGPPAVEPGSTSTSQVAFNDPMGLRASADAMRLEYALALEQLSDLPMPPELRDGIAELDRSAAQLEAALETDAGHPFLLNRLQRTYEKRLQLSRLALQSLALHASPPGNHRYGWRPTTSGVTS